MRFNLHSIKSTLESAAVETTLAVQASIRNPEKFTKNYMEIVTPGVVVSGMQLALPLMMPSLAAPLYFRRVRVGMLACHAIATAGSVAVTRLETK